MTTTSTVAITLDMRCCRCIAKIQKILCCLQERCRFVFEKVVYEKDKVLVSGPFNAVDLYCKLQCKAGCFATKIEIVPPPPPPEKTKKKKKKKNVPPKTTPPEPQKCKVLIPYPYPCPCPTCPAPPRSCPSPPPPPCPALPPAPTCLALPPPPSCPTPPPPPRPCPPPPPPRPCPPPVCNNCPAWTPCQCRGYPWVVCCEEKPDEPCAVM